MDTPSGRFIRASIIPYTLIDGVPYYCLFVDAQYREITDAGGGCKRDQHFLDEAIRECNEESMGIFDFTGKREYLTECECYIYERSITILAEVKFSTVQMSLSTRKFRDLYEKTFYKALIENQRQHDHIENCFMLWLSDEVLTKLVKKENVENVFSETFMKLDEEFTQKCHKLMLEQEPKQTFSLYLYNKYIGDKAPFTKYLPQLWEQIALIFEVIYSGGDRLV